jgi:hypothetical protein
MQQVGVLFQLWPFSYIYSLSLSILAMSWCHHSTLLRQSRPGSWLVPIHTPCTFLVWFSQQILFDEQRRGYKACMLQH